MTGIVRLTPAPRDLGACACRPARVAPTTAGPQWRPAVDVKETEAGLNLLIELPGVAKKDLDIALNGHHLTVSAERPQDDEASASYHRRELRHGSLSRSFRLPASVDSAKVTASLRDGLLSVELPKAEAARKRQISVQ